MLCNFHDWRILSISERGARIELVVVDESGNRLVLIDLVGVKTLRVVDYSLQNIVCRFIDSSSRQVESGVVRHYVEWVTSRVDAGTWLRDDVIDRCVSEIESGDRVLVAIVPSNGAEIAAICERVGYHELGGASARTS